jgi:broad specificity phosphatase PhoE
MNERPDTPSLWVIRHGKPDVPKNAPRVTREEFNQYLADYDQAGLSVNEMDRLRTQYQAYPKPDLVLASDLPRALQTAELFARGTPIVTDPVLREVPVAIPDTSGWFLSGRWPGEWWWSYLRVAWFRGLQQETPALSRQRAQRAMEFIASYRQHHQIAVVSHSGFLLILMDQMHRQHHVRGPRLPSIVFGKPTEYHRLGPLQSET